tara:strand:+ start:917 stop:1840 length:924 start_codon:yes stop_codon:yes gene_type:complete
MVNNYNLLAFEENNEIAQSYFDKIDILWPPKENEEPASVAMKKKIFHEKKYIVHPYIFYCNDQPQGITWIELNSNHYGNVTAYVPEQKYFKPLVKLLNAKQYFDNKMIELVNLDQNEAFKDACFSAELKPNIRQRMYLWLNEYRSEDLSHLPFTFEKYTPDWYEWASKISVDAHAVSKDYMDYEEMKSPANRLRLEKRISTENKGKLNSNASLVIFYNNKPVGYCLVVEVKCWGYESVPWIFDICIDPEFHGQGLGKALLHKVVKTIYDDNYDIMGLAVTLTNVYAISLYHKLGFQDLDIFYEFIQV